MPSWLTDPARQSVQQNKAQMRLYYRTVRKKLSSESRNLLDSALLANTVSLPCFQQADWILFYYPTRGEPNILPLARRALQMEKKIAFPRSDPETCTMTFHRITDFTQLTVGTYDIPEPDASLPIPTASKQTLCLVPALAFDHFGYRLGYGKGYYDRYLKTFPGTTIGLVYSGCLAELLPHDSHDRKVQRIITEKGDMFPYEEAYFS